jgi:hypothetical protein
MRAWIACGSFAFGLVLAVACSSSDPDGPSRPGDAGADAPIAQPGDDAALDARADVAREISDAPLADAFAPMVLVSPAFADGLEIPALHTCDGASYSPQLAWSAGPPATKSYAVVAVDKTLGGTNNVIWAIYDIVPTYLQQNFPQGYAAGGAHQTPSSFDAAFGYAAPCPPVGPKHTYTFTVYALDVATLPDVSVGSTPQQAIAQITAHELEAASLTGDYTRAP